MTLVVRDECDVLDAHLRYHLGHGVDFVIATDNLSQDGTSAVLEAYARQGRAHVLREGGEHFEQGVWVTRMARMAATEFGADWVINSDADEFWWPRDGSMREYLSAIPARFGVVLGIWRHFVPRPESLAPFWERMLVRGRDSRTASPYWPSWLKAVHRAHPDVVVPWGNHDAHVPGLATLRGWTPFEILHFPVRSQAQMARKFSIATAPHVRPAARAMEERGSAEVYDSLAIDDAALARGLADRSLVVDTRLRDVIQRTSETRTAPSLQDDADLAEEFDAVYEIDARVRLDRRLAEFESRLIGVEAALALRSIRHRARFGAVQHSG